MTAADDAWVDAIDAEIVGYEVSGDEYFRARAADLKDIRAQVLRGMTDGGDEASPPGAILFGDDIAPTRFLETDWSLGGGIALTAGSTASHVAMLARSRGVPMVVGLGASAIEIDGMALLDAEHGALVLSPTVADVESFRRAAHEYGARRALAPTTSCCVPRQRKPARSVRVQVNIADPADVDAIDIAACDGVGLMRTEFLFGKASGLPDEETQYAAYRKVLEWAGGKPVTIRTVDAGGDKPVPGFTVEESNPFLGLRGIRLSLARPDVFRIQIRALLRAAPHGNLKVMFPMIAVADEYDRAAALFAEEARELARQGVSAQDAAARHHGRGAVGGDRAAGLRQGRVLLDRLQRSDAVCDGGGARQRCGRASEQCAPSRGAAADRSGRSASAASTALRSACAAMPAAIRRRSRRCWKPACATCRSCRPSLPWPRRRSLALRDRLVAKAALPVPGDAEEAIRAYKTVLSAVIDQRPSGMRQRLADALGKHRSFVTQITSPAYSTPIPSKHLPLIFSVCHFSTQERDLFLGAYQVAHPGKVQLAESGRRVRHLSLTVPDLGDDKQNAALDRAINEFIHRISSIAGKGG